MDAVTVTDVETFGGMESALRVIAPIGSWAVAGTAATIIPAKKAIASSFID
jgi:hypothetical protein